MIVQKLNCSEKEGHICIFVHVPRLLIFTFKCLAFIRMAKYSLQIMPWVRVLTITTVTSGCCGPNLETVATTRAKPPTLLAPPPSQHYCLSSPPQHGTLYVLCTIDQSILSLYIGKVVCELQAAVPTEECEDDPWGCISKLRVFKKGAAVVST